MKFIDGTFPTWIALMAKAVDTPYQTILVMTERFADLVEKHETLADYNYFLSYLESAEQISFSIGDVGEIFVLLGSYWVRGEELMDQLSHIEKKIVAENVEYRLSIFAQEARGDKNG